MIGRLLGVLRHPVTTMADVAGRPDWLLPWIVLLTIWIAAAVPLLGSAVGRQALVDEQVRRVEALGGTVDDARYAGWQAHPPLTAYFAGGGRVLLAPPLTVGVALVLLAAARRDGARASLAQALAVAVYASVPLVVGTVAAIPLQYARESLSSPFNLATVARLADEGTWMARTLGAVDLFGLWWTWLLALGLAALTGRPAKRYLGWLPLGYVAVAAVVALAALLSGGA